MLVRIICPDVAEIVGGVGVVARLVQHNGGRAIEARDNNVDVGGARSTHAAPRRQVVELEQILSVHCQAREGKGAVFVSVGDVDEAVAVASTRGGRPAAAGARGELGRRRVVNDVEAVGRACGGRRADGNGQAE